MTETGSSVIVRSMAQNTIAIRPTLFTRILRAVGLLPTGEIEFVAGADYSAHDAAEPQYPKGNAMSAFAAFPWVYVCVAAIASDLSGLPLIAVKGTGADAASLDSHPVLELLSNPSSRVSPDLFRRQMITDYVLTGDAYALIAGDKEPQALLRLAPQRVRVVPWTDGQPGSYEYDSSQGGRSKYEYSEIMHMRSASWEDDPSSLYGTGAIRPLDADLRTERAAVNSAANTATIGRPSGIISPNEDGDRWSSEQITRMRTAYEKQLGGKSGVLFLGGAANFQQLAWSPRDLEFVEQRRMTRESVLAVFSVPPTRVGLPSANYATAREQARMYWTALMAKASMIDAELTRLARMFPNSEDVRVVHDFAAVEALQESRTERVDRVRKWWDMGIDLQQAGALEGFEEIPESQDFGFQSSDQEQADAAKEDQATMAIRSLLEDGTESRDISRSEILERYYDPDLDIESYPIPETREERLVVWRSYIERLHGPAERAIRSTMSKFLKQQKGRFIRRLNAIGRKSGGGQVVQKPLTDKELQELLDELDEALRLERAAAPLVGAVTSASFTAAKKQMGSQVRDIEWNPVRRSELRQREVARMVAMLNDTTLNNVQQIVQAGMDAGLPIREIANQLMEDRQHLFDRVRANRIARTEATRLSNAASLAAMDEAADLGLTIYKMWDTAGDDLVRDSHAALDGEIFLSDDEFTTSSGARIQQPAASGDASFDINCRCNLIPFIDRDDAEEESARRKDKDNPREW